MSLAWRAEVGKTKTWDQDQKMQGCVMEEGKEAKREANAYCVKHLFTYVVVGLRIDEAQFAFAELAQCLRTLTSTLPPPGRISSQHPTSHMHTTRSIGIGIDMIQRQRTETVKSTSTSSYPNPPLPLPLIAVIFYALPHDFRPQVKIPENTAARKQRIPITTMIGVVIAFALCSTISLKPSSLPS